MFVLLYIQQTIVREGWIIKMKNLRRILIIALACLAIYSVYGVLKMEAATAVWHKEQVVVHSGDTLWNIAGRWTTDGEDVREVLYRIQEENKLVGNGYLQPGQRIIVPIRVDANMMAKK